MKGKSRVLIWGAVALAITVIGLIGLRLTTTADEPEGVLPSAPQAPVPSPPQPTVTPIPVESPRGRDIYPTDIPDPVEVKFAFEECDNQVQRVEDMLEQAPVSLPPDWTVVYVHCGEVDEHYGHTDYHYQAIHVQSEFLSDDKLLGLLIHEIGHAIDFEYFGDEEQKTWMEARGIEGPWLGSCGDGWCIDSPEEDWAEVLAYCYVPQEGSWLLEEVLPGGLPTEEQCELAKELAAWHD